MTPAQNAKIVSYLHHTRDRDGDIVFYFTDPSRGDNGPLWSSPVLGIRRCLSAVLDSEGHGGLCRYRITTMHTEYIVQMPRDKADHLARELVGFPPAPRP